MSKAENRQEPNQEPPPKLSPQGPPKTFDAQELFQGAREIWIEHTGIRYRLRITRRNKLILQK
jgi:hemin uptake protein HemP